MAKKLDPNELVTFKELLMANSIQVDTAVQLLIENEFFTKMKKVRIEYMTLFIYPLSKKAKFMKFNY